MDTTYEEPGLFSQCEDRASPIDTENGLTLEQPASPKITMDNQNPNVLSPFSSLASRAVTYNSSINDKQSQDDSMFSESSDLEEEGPPVNQSSATRFQENRIIQDHTALNNPSSSQGSSSTFSPFSSPISSPHSEINEYRLPTTTASIIQPSPKYSGPFLHPGTSNATCTGERERLDRCAKKKQFFKNPSKFDKLKNSQSCVDSTLVSTTSQDVCAPGQRFQSQSRLGSSGHANLLKKLMGRELTGVVRKNPTNPRNPQVRLFSRLPARLAFCLRDAIPHSAIENGHIFMGFSKCGQFLLSYTQ